MQSKINFLKLLSIIIVSLLSGCSDQAPEMRKEAVEEYLKIMTAPGSVDIMKSLYRIPDDYETVRCEILDSFESEKTVANLYCFAYTFSNGDRAIVISEFCYWDPDLAMPRRIKSERLVIDDGNVIESASSFTDPEWD